MHLPLTLAIKRNHPATPDNSAGYIFDGRDTRSAEYLAVSREFSP
jgi:hypothetical protein